MIRLLANPWSILGSLAVVLALCGTCYVKGRSDGLAVEIAARATLEEVARESREAAMQAAAEAIAKISITHTTIRQKAEVITREKIQYRDCVNDPALSGLLDAARANQPAAEPLGDRVVSGTGASPTPDVR